jgi:hypothetical protein
VTVGDTRGLSYYGDESIMNQLSMDGIILEKARENLIHIGLIAWQVPLYQVLSLEVSFKQPLARSVMDKPLSLGDILKQAIGGAR